MERRYQTDNHRNSNSQLLSRRVQMLWGCLRRGWWNLHRKQVFPLKNKNKNTGNKPVAHSSTDHKITEGAPEPMVSKVMVPSTWRLVSSRGERQWHNKQMKVKAHTWSVYWKIWHGDMSENKKRNLLRRGGQGNLSEKAKFSLSFKIKSPKKNKKNKIKSPSVKPAGGRERAHLPPLLA